MAEEKKRVSDRFSDFPFRVSGEAEKSPGDLLRQLAVDAAMAKPITRHLDGLLG